MSPELIAVAVGAVCGGLGGSALGAVFGVAATSLHKRIPGWLWALIAMVALILIVVGGVIGFELSQPSAQHGNPSPSATSRTPSRSAATPPVNQRTPRASSSSAQPDTQATGVLLDHYSDPDAVGEAVCTGNVNDRAAQPSGRVSQTFVVPAGFTTISSLTVQVDPQPALTVHLTLSSASGQTATQTATASGDTRFEDLAMPVQAGETITATFTMSATQKTGVTMYLTPGGYGTAIFANSCPWGGGANLIRTDEGLRMLVTGITR